MISSMKKALKTPKYYFIGLALATIGLAVPFGVYGITMIPSLNANPFPYMYLLYVFFLVYILLGFVISDIQVARWRKKTANYDNKLPDEVKDKAWAIRFPFYFAAVILAHVILVFEIIYFATGAYPFPMVM